MKQFLRHAMPLSRLRSERPPLADSRQLALQVRPAAIAAVPIVL